MTESGGGDGVFAAALRKLTAGTAAATTRRAGPVPGAVNKIRGAQYPPLYTAGAASSAVAASGAAPVDTVEVAAVATERAAATLTDALSPPGKHTHSASPAAAGAEGGEARGRASACGFALGASVKGNLRAGGARWEDADSISAVRLAKFQRCLEYRPGSVALGGSGTLVVDIAVLRELAWSGVPCCFRVASWQMLLGYLPPNRERQLASLHQKQVEYQRCVSQYYGSFRGGGSTLRNDAEQGLLRQVLVDVPRTNPDIPLFRCELVQRSMERVLYVWALRHPASGYVQGINDLASTFYAVFMAPWADIDTRDLSHVPPAVFLEVEADVYWCLTRLLDGILDHYTPSQPGIQRMIYRLRELVHRIDEPLVSHLEGSGVEFFHFAFRWMNCLLMRELPFVLVIRLWDTCLAERDGFDSFYVYVCAALLLKFSSRLKAMKFQELVTFIQKLPTRDWTVKDLEELLAQSFVYKTLFEAAQSHLS